MLLAPDISRQDCSRLAAEAAKTNLRLARCGRLCFPHTTAPVVGGLTWRTSMIAVNNEREEYGSDWQSPFLNMLSNPTSIAQLHFGISTMHPKRKRSRKGLCTAARLVRLHDQGPRTGRDACKLGLLRSRQVKRGRPAAGR